MSFLDDLRRGFRPLEEPPPTVTDWRQRAAITSLKLRRSESDAENVETRAIDPFHSFPSIDAQLLAIQGITDTPWRAPGLAEMLGVPSITGAVTLISKTVGSLTMRALKNEVEVPPEDRPRLIIRPQPNKTANLFFMQTAWSMATRGEAWWWVAKRDADGNAISLFLVPPEQITVAINQQNLLRPTITWRNTKMRNEDMVQIPYLLDVGSLRGVGPLQLCGAALSVAVESQEWAANFYADGGATTAPIIHSAEILDDDPNDPTAATEAERFADAWSAKGNNRPRVVDPRVESIDFPTFNANGAQMLDSRMYQNGETARMFLIPGVLLEYQMSGSSLTYQNRASIYADFLQRCLAPNYLSPMEAAMGDLVPRAITPRFDTDNLTRDDAKTRFETYEIGIRSGVLTAERAQSFEGYLPGDTDNAPVPFSPPQAIITRLPIQQSRSAHAEPLEDIRCDGRRMFKTKLIRCNAKVAVGAPFSGRCWRCGKEHSAYIGATA